MRSRKAFKDGINLILLCLALAAIHSCGKKEENVQNNTVLNSNFNIQWADSSYWDDGKAEVAQYAAQRKIYGKNRNYELTLITVSEDFNEKFRVKTDDYKRQDLYKVIKLNAFANIQTDNYPYHFLTSLFFKRANPVELHKATLSSQEWCGNTFKEFTREKENYELKFSSYWDTEGTGIRTVPLKGELLFEDQLVYTLRTLNFDHLPDFKAQILSSQVGNKVGNQDIYQAELRVSDADSLWRVDVKLASGKINVYEFEKVYPNTLRNLKMWDGQSLSLSRVSRYAYWQN